MSTPAIDMYDHPIFNPVKLHLETPAMRQLEEDIHRWVWTGTTGGLVYGGARVGKTTALKSIANRLYTRGHKAIPCFFVSVADRDTKTIASIFKNLCWNANLSVNINDTADILANRFIHHVAEGVAKSNCLQTVLFVDEMQRLTPGQLNAFAEIYDGLTKLQIASTTVFVGNDPECWKLVERIESVEYAHIHGRFFNQGVKYQGLSSKIHVKECLSQYDELRYPENGKTYTEFFLPNETQAGWKLASLSGDLWRFFHEYQKEFSIPSWGMQYFTASVNLLLSDFLPNTGVENIPDNVFRECIRISGLVPSLVKPS